MLPLLFIFLSFTTGAYLSDIVARGDTSVVFGQDASLACSLPSTSGVKQVTWQRVRGQDVQILATFSERFKENVDEQYVGKIVFNASFNSTSIKINNITFEDEACYICSFKVYPTGPKREKLCLSVKGISETTVAVNPASNSDSDVVVSCSATGKPTPTIQWKSREQELKEFMSINFTTLNKDSSTTTTSNITLPLSTFHSKSVECFAQSDSMDVSEKIHIPRLHEVEVPARNYIITFSVLIVVAVVVIVIVIFVLYSRIRRDTFGSKSLYDEPLHIQNEEC